MAGLVIKKCMQVDNKAGIKKEFCEVYKLLDKAGITKEFCEVYKLLDKFIRKTYKDEDEPLTDIVTEIDKVYRNRSSVKMFRPNFEDIGGGYIQCSCGQILQTKEATREHWQSGHFDTPIQTEKSIRVNFSEEDLQRLMNGETFDWCFDGVNIHLYQGEEEEEE